MGALHGWAQFRNKPYEFQPEPPARRATPAEFFALFALLSRQIDEFREDFQTPNL